MKKVKFKIFIFTTVIFVACGSNKETDSHTNLTTEEKVVIETTPVSKENHGQSGVSDDVSDMNALELALSNDDFSTLCTAVTETHIEDVLVNAGPLTVFAPLNSGFDKLPEGVLDDLLAPEDKTELAMILKAHVAPANYPIKQLKKEVKKDRKLYMASGDYLTVTREGDDIFVEGIKILESHKVSNGWVHVIDNVISPVAENK